MGYRLFDLAAFIQGRHDVAQAERDPLIEAYPGVICGQKYLTETVTNMADCFRLDRSMVKVLKGRLLVVEHVAHFLSVLNQGGIRFVESDAIRTHLSKEVIRRSCMCDRRS